MSRLHAVYLAVAVTAVPIYAQTPADKGDKQTPAATDDAIRRLLLRLAPVPLYHGQRISTLTFSPDGKTVTTVSNAEAKVSVFDSATGELLRSWQLPTRRIGHSALSSDGKLLAAADPSGRAALWDAATGKPLRPLKGTAGGCLAISPDGKSVVSGLADGTLGVWDTATGEQRCRLPKSAWTLSLALAFSADGKRIAAPRPDGTVGIWDTTAGKELQSLPAGAPDLRMLSFTPNGKSLASSDGRGVVRMWDLATAKERRQLQLPLDHDLTCGLFTADGRALLTGGADGTVRLWEMASGKERHRFPQLRGSIDGAVLAADGRSIAMATTNKIAFVREVGALTPAETHLGPAPRPKDLETAWADLAAPDAATAYRAVAVLAEKRGDAVAFLKKQLQPAPATTPAEMTRLIVDLGSANFATRQKAMKELERLHEAAEDALEAVLRGDPPLEVRQRVRGLLDRIKRQGLPLERVRPLRAVEALEAIGTDESRQLLQNLAGGAAGDPLTEEARAALARLRKGSSPK
ncbi:MAG TPA: WD40 repeat domain-containing protein [Gemmataceae bacterium]|nr:WD40 repeat domain-containing protein [Gemmataceae bacterium]